MNIKFHKTAPLEGEIHLDLSPDDYLFRVEETIRKYRSRIELKGFRKGKVSSQLVKKIYGPSIVWQTVVELAKEASLKYLEEQNLRPWETPIMVESSLSTNPDIDIQNPGELQFKFECGLLPEVELSMLNQIEVDRFVITDVAESTVMEVIQRLQITYGTPTEVAKSETNDTLYGILTNAEGFRQGVRLPATGMKIDNQDIHFTDLQVHDQVSLHLEPNQNYNITHPYFDYEETTELLKDLKGEYNFTVEKIYRLVLAELNQDFFESFGEVSIKDLEEYKEKLRNFFIIDTQATADLILAYQIKQKITDEFEMELPKNFIHKGLKIKYPDYEEKIIEQLYNYIQFKLRWELVAEKIAEENDIQVTVDELVHFLTHNLQNRKGSKAWASLSEEERRKRVERQFATGKMTQEYQEAYNCIFQEKVLTILKNKLNLRIQEKSVEAFKEMVATMVR